MDKMNELITIADEFKQYLIADGKTLPIIECYIGDVAGFVKY
jgi:hypothetical protein